MPKESWKVLLVDDDEGVRRELATALDSAGYHVTEAADGEAALALSEELSPQIVITDLHMPWMNGFEILQRLKEVDPDREVIVLTAHGDMSQAVRALRLDASDFIAKPIDQKVLREALERAKKRYSARKELQEYTAMMEERWMDTAEELANTFDFQKKLIESSIDGIIGCDRIGKVIIFNKSMEQILGYPKGMVIGKMSLKQFFSLGEWERFEDKLRSREYGGRNRLFLYETTLISKIGHKIPVQLSATILFQEEEQIGVVGFFRDLRRLRRLKQQVADQARLLHQDKMVSLGKLAASVVHEINNPLAGVLNYIRLMTRITERSSITAQRLEKFRGYLGLMESEISRCSEIVSNLLAFSRKSALRFSEVSINELLEKSIVLSEHKLTLQNIRIEARLNPEIPMVMGDFNQLQQCILNLFFNAIDAMPDGGRLRLQSLYIPDKGMVEIRVADNGRGIEKEDLKRIFDPFFSTKKEGKGLGLGLSVVYGIIDRHKGTITVESELGRGTEFFIKLPVNDDGARFLEAGRNSNP